VKLAPYFNLKQYFTVDQLFPSESYYFCFFLLSFMLAFSLRFCGLKREVKVKVNLPLCLTKHHAMKTYWGVEV
jgi:hypothetical protein